MFNVRWYSTDDRLDNLVDQTVQTAGIKGSIHMKSPEDLSMIGDYVVIVSDGSITYEDLALDNPDQQFLIVGSQLRYQLPNVNHCDDLMALYYRLRTMVSHHQKRYDSDVGAPEKRVERARKRARRFVPCAFCGKKISVLGLGLKTHEASCRAKTLKLNARGKVLTHRQVCGKSKGSILIVEIPSDLSLKEIGLQRGLHIICNQKLIGNINAKNKELFNYQLDQDEEDNIHPGE